MNYSQLPISPYCAELPRKTLRMMINLVHTLHQLSENKAYQAQLYPSLPETAQHHPQHHAVMMGYDFHLTATGAKLIEVNTNAGGVWLASLAYHPNKTMFPKRLAEKLLHSFLSDFALFCKKKAAIPNLLVIVDENPQNQFLYPEMRLFAQLFQNAGIDCQIADPTELNYQHDGLYLNGKRVEMIYNRHCDFYLETASMSVVRQAWLNAQVCLSPNPFVYGLLADKRRMILWSDAEQLKTLNLSAQTEAILAETIPETRALADLSSEQAWQTRKQWVFKPDNGYGSRGVYSGDKLTTSKLAQLALENTLLQQRIPASITQITPELAFKTDFRLFVYRQQILAISARLYQGQVTNLRTENGGFAKVRVIN